MRRAATARLFVAIEPPASVREALCAWGREAALASSGSPAQPVRRAPAAQRAEREASALRLLEPQALHLTLIFLGSRPAWEVDAIAQALEEGAGAMRVPLGELSAGAPLWLPSRRPRAVAIEIKEQPSGGLASLHAAVSGALARAVDWQPERRRYRAHVTVARVSAAGARGRGASMADELLPATPAVRFTPSSIVLYRSRLSPAGAAYEALANSGLGGGR